MPDRQTMPFSDAEWASLVGLAGTPDLTPISADEADDDLLAASDELTRVSRRIAGQYAEIVAGFSANAFRGEAGRDAADHSMAAVDALLRLARAAGDTTQEALLSELKPLLPQTVEGRRNSRTRQQALARLRDWIPRFAETLQEDDARRLLDLVRWDRGRAPLMDELAEIDGIGPKRLGRLYAAGLHTMEVVAGADPHEIAQVTGLPSGLATKVVAETRRYAMDERRRCLEGLRDRARRLREVLRSVSGTDDDMRGLAEEAIREVELTFQTLNSMEAT